MTWIHDPRDGLTTHLGRYSEVDLKPFRCGLVAGAPPETVRTVDAGVTLLTSGVPLGRVHRRRGDLPVFYRTGYHSQCADTVFAFYITEEESTDTLLVFHRTEEQSTDILFAFYRTEEEIYRYPVRILQNGRTVYRYPVRILQNRKKSTDTLFAFYRTAKQDKRPSTRHLNLIIYYCTAALKRCRPREYVIIYNHVISMSNRKKYNFLIIILDILFFTYSNNNYDHKTCKRL